MADVSVLNLNGTNYSIKDATARSTGNSASSKAQAAQTAATEAKNTAGEAKTTANSANSTAQAAKTAADDALERTYDITYTQNTETITFTKYSE